MKRLLTLSALLVTVPCGVAQAATRVSLMVAPSGNTVLLQADDGGARLSVDYARVAPGLDRVTVTSQSWDNRMLPGAGCSGTTEVSCTLPEIAAVRFEGGAGDDVLTILDTFKHLSAPSTVVAFGEEGNDSLGAWHTTGVSLHADGGPGYDALYGGHGSNVLVGGDGADDLWGGYRNDVILADDAGPESDAVHCEGGPDRVRLDANDVTDDQCEAGYTPPAPGLTDPLLALLTVRLP